MDAKSNVWRRRSPLVAAAVLPLLLSPLTGLATAEAAGPLPIPVETVPLPVPAGPLPVPVPGPAHLVPRGGDTGEPGAEGPEAAVSPLADVAHHGHVTLTPDGRLSVTVESRSHGPESLANSTFKLGFSTRFARDQQLPATCVWGSDRVVLCSTGPLRVGGAAHRVTLDLVASGTPDEVLVEIGTYWNGGAQDRNLRNHHHEILAPATGDPYVF
ncbi:hypothetical protein [Streptomyces sp. NPDC058953]|uniref:hypothetical protein n=1 Tax=unclassified Streptomyces TaxID=2593676 RepID=UPI00367428B3